MSLLEEITLIYIVASYVAVGVSIHSEMEEASIDDAFFLFAPLTVVGFIVYKPSDFIGRMLYSLVGKMEFRLVEFITGIKPTSRWRYAAYKETINPTISYHKWATMTEFSYISPRSHIDLTVLPDSVASILLRGNQLRKVRLDIELPNLISVDMDGVWTDTSWPFENSPILKFLTQRNGHVVKLDLSEVSDTVVSIDVSNSAVMTVVFPEVLEISSLILDGNKITRLQPPMHRTISESPSYLSLAGNPLLELMDPMGYLNYPVINLRGTPISRKPTWCLSGRNVTSVISSRWY